MGKRLVDVFVAVSLGNRFLIDSGKNKMTCDNLVDYKQLVVKNTDEKFGYTTWPRIRLLFSSELKAIASFRGLFHYQSSHPNVTDTQRMKGNRRWTFGYDSKCQSSVGVSMYLILFQVK